MTGKLNLPTKTKIFFRIYFEIVTKNPSTFMMMRFDGKFGFKKYIMMYDDVI